MTDEEIKKIAIELSKQMACHNQPCQVFDTETITDINKFFKRLRSSANVAWFTAIGLVITAIAGIVFAGLAARIRGLF